MKRIFVFLFGVISYALCMGTLAYAAGFIGNFGVSKAIDSGPVGPLGTALLINAGLLGLFAIQHSGMARTSFKNFLTRFIPEPAERSTYVIMSSLCLIILFWFWQPMGGTIWHVENFAGQIVLYTIYGLGWALLVGTTFLINHFDLFGLRQVWLYLRKEPYTPVEFRVPSLYQFVRHPLYVGFILLSWATPTMTIAHLVFAIACTGYILVGIQFEERDLSKYLGDAYREYKKSVPMLIPSFRRYKSETENIHS